MDLITTPNFAHGDDFYEALIATHQDLSTPQSHALNARLVLLLANHIGQMDVLRQALEAARDGIEPKEQADRADRPDGHYPAPHHTRS